MSTLRRAGARAEAAVTPSRRVLGTVAGTASVAVAAAALVAPSSAAWVDTEHIASAAGTLVCDGETPAVDSRAWGRVLSAGLGGASLDPIVSTDGVSVSNLAPATTSTGTSDVAGGPSYLGADAWAAPLQLDVLDLVELAPGITLPLDTGTGVYSQYGRATAAGLMAGASGAVTTDAGGLVSLDAPDTDAPRLGALQLSTVLDSVLAGLGEGLVAQLADVQLEVGAVGSLAALDGCDALWDTAPASGLDRDYLVASLDLGLTSSIVAGLAQTLDGVLSGLEDTLDATLDANIAGELIDEIVADLFGPLDALTEISLGDDPLTVDVTGSIDLTEVRSLLTSTLDDTVVTVDLATGRVTADLAALVGEAYGDSDGLNGRDPNTSVLTPAVINALLGRVSTMLENFIVSDVQAALVAALLETEVVIDIGIEVDATVTIGIPPLDVTTTVPDAVSITASIEGQLGGIAGQPGYPLPVVESDIGLNLTPDPVLNAALSTLINVTIGSLLDDAVASLVPGIGAAVASALLDALQSVVTSTVAGLVGPGGPVQTAVTALGGVLNLLASLVRVLLNAQPDQPGGVAPPAVAPPGRWFVSALHVGVVNGDASLLDVWAASSSVGPYEVR